MRKRRCFQVLHKDQKLPLGSGKICVLPLTHQSCPLLPPCKCRPPPVRRRSQAEDHEEACEWVEVRSPFATFPPLCESLLFLRCSSGGRQEWSRTASEQREAQSEKHATQQSLLSAREAQVVHRKVLRRSETACSLFPRTTQALQALKNDGDRREVQSRPSQSQPVQARPAGSSPTELTDIEVGPSAMFLQP